MEQRNFIVVTTADDGRELRIPSLSRDAARALAAAHRQAGRQAAIRFALSDAKEVTVVGFDEPLDRMQP